LVQLMRQANHVQATLDAADRLVPVPLSNQRLKSRGFNQALLLAQQLDPQKTCTRTLLRIADTAPQSRLNRAQRMRNVQHAFAVEPAQAAALQGQRLVLVDDVMTSGASLFAAAKTLRAAGAAHISAVVFARTDFD
jgi:ComF family protein